MFIINQPAGLGDIFYCLKIGYILQEVIWPVQSQYLYIRDYLITSINFVDQNEHVSGTIIDLKNAGKSHPDDFMRAKYKSIRCDDDDWIDYFNIRRRYDREKKIDGNFILKCSTFGTRPDSYKIDIDVKGINIEDLGLEHVFDYCWLIEHADEIHMVDTVFTYLVEKLHTTDKLFMYPRTPFERTIKTKTIRHKNWKYIE